MTDDFNCMDRQQQEIFYIILNIYFYVSQKKENYTGLRLEQHDGD